MSRVMRRLSGAALAIGLTMAPAAQAADFRFHGLLDLVAAERSPAYGLNSLMRGDSPFDPYGVRLFVDSQVNDRLQVYSQFVMRDATTPYVDGAYLLYNPIPMRDVHLMAGKVPWPIGTYAPRTYSNHNPLIGTPLMYQYHTTLLWYEIPPNVDALLATAGQGQYGVNYEGYPEGRGMTVVDDSYWDVGVALTGSERPFEYALGVVAGTPGWGSTTEDENSAKTPLGRLGIAPLPSLRLGVSGAYGSYLMGALNSELPAGKDVNDYHQKLGMADLELLAGHFELRAEGARNVWQTPTVGDLALTTGYLELKYSLSFGAFLAGRVDAMRFGEIVDSTGTSRPWDSNVSRYETGMGYRFDREIQAKLIYQHTRMETEGGAEEYRNASMLAAQLSIAF